MIYNPFRPHIATNGTNYIVRKLTWLGWETLDCNSNHWWFTNQYQQKYCETKDKIKAEEMLKRVQPYKKI